MTNQIFNPFKFRPLIGIRGGNSSTSSTLPSSPRTWSQPPQLNQPMKQVNLQEFTAELRRQIAKHQEGMEDFRRLAEMAPNI